MLKNLIKKYLIDESLDYKVVLSLLILKKVSDKWTNEFEIAKKEAIEDGLSEEDADTEAKQEMYHDIKFNNDLLWEEIRKKGASEGVGKILEHLSQSLKFLSDNNSQFSHLSELINFQIYSDQSEQKSKIISFFEDLSDNKKYDLTKIDFDKIIEYFILEFSLKEAKKGGIYTPKEIISIIYQVLDIKDRSSLYDPSSGYGEFLSMAHRLNKNLLIYGQEIKSEQYLISQINFMLNNFIDFKLKPTFSLKNPIKEGNSFKTFDYVVSNPKWNLENCDEENLKDSEFAKERIKDIGGSYPSKDSGDWAWISHIIASSKEKSAIVMDTGCLFRGSGDKTTKEKVIRSNIVNKNLIESIILFPEKLFFSNGGGAGVIIFFNKNKPKDRENKILIINAQEEFIQHPEFKKLRLLSPENISKIVDVINDFEEIPYFSKKVDLDYIKENDYNLNPSLYVYPEEKLPVIDISQELADLKTIDNELFTLNPKILQIKEMLKEIN